MRNPVRPKTGGSRRREPLQRAKRTRQEVANLVEVQITVPATVAAKLTVAQRAPDFTEQPDVALDRLVVRLADFPQLQDSAWNRVDEFIPAREALQLYERNWRRVSFSRTHQHGRPLSVGATTS